MDIRNFAIIAHIDHGKSTLADRLLEITGAVKVGSGEQMLDTMELEKEKGITIKLNPARMYYRPSRPEILNPKSEALNKFQIQNTNSANSFDIRNSKLEFTDSTFQLNLIDTPGHVDFGYEVSRSLAAVEGVLLLVDASQGIQAQTLTNLHLVQKLGLVIIPVVNKIDLPTAQVEDTAEQVMKLLGCQLDDICFVSGKTGEGVADLLLAITNRIPAPSATVDKPLRALVFDSFFDPYLGAVAYVKVLDGRVSKQQRLLMRATTAQFDCLQTGYLQIKRFAQDTLENGEIGYVATGLKTVRDCRVGDTIVEAGSPAEALPGYQTPKPMVFASFFPEPGEERLLSQALEKLQLNDASLTYEPIHSKALGPGYNIGFLGLLHMEIVKERLNREFDVSVLVTTPTVAYKFQPDRQEEPWVDLEIVAPNRYYGTVSELCSRYRMNFVAVEYIGDRVICRYEAPLAEVIVEFYDRLKSVSAGYASMDYQLTGYREADLVAVDLLIAGEKIDAFTQYMVRSRADNYGRTIVSKLKDLIPRQNFEISLQAAIGGKIIARQTVSAFRKDVTAKLYGGDVTRKKKLLEKQKKGKKKMRSIGRVEIPNQVFIDLLRQ
ncbi:MAG: translation elongation factor 4 [Patescibacteria group bacterium]